MRDFFSFLRFSCEIELIPVKFLCDSCEIPARLCLNQRIFLGKVEETKTEKRKMRGTFGTKENSNSFPPEYCTILKLSHEKKHLSRPLVFSSCVEVQGSCALQFLCYKFLCSKQPKFSVPVFWNPVVFHFSSYLIPAFFPIPIFWIPSFQTGLEWDTCKY